MTWQNQRLPSQRIGPSPVVTPTSSHDLDLTLSPIKKVPALNIQPTPTNRHYSQTNRDPPCHQSPEILGQQCVRPLNFQTHLLCPFKFSFPYFYFSKKKIKINNFKIFLTFFYFLYHINIFYYFLNKKLITIQLFFLLFYINYFNFISH
jgi:hypothetical protein